MPKSVATRTATLRQARDKVAQKVTGGRIKTWASLGTACKNGEEKIVLVSDYKPEDGDDNVFFEDIEDLPFSDEAKRMILEWFAYKLWVLLEEGSGEPDYYCKAYDPLIIEGNIAHSYVFDLEGGGRHHPFKDLKHLEKMLMNESISRIQEMS